VRQLGVGGVGGALGVRRTLAAIMSSRMGSRALLAGATPRARPLQGGISRDGLSMAPLPWASPSWSFCGAIRTGQAA